MKEIGGYFELEITKCDHNSGIPQGILVNSGRHALEFILRSLGKDVKKVYLPYYTCDVVLEPIRRLNLDYDYYYIDRNLEIAEPRRLEAGEYIILNNYFGIKDRYISEMVKVYGERLIVDNCQAWYAKPENGANFIYSPRKFFGLPDGGVVAGLSCNDVVLPDGFSAGRCSHLLKRIDSGAFSGYMDFKANSKQLKDEPLTRMSHLTECLLNQIDFEKAKSRRRRNYEILHSRLSAINGLHLPPLTDFECPMVYPYLTEKRDLRRFLIENKVFVATYWPDVSEKRGVGELENSLTQDLLPLPIDQRYGEKEMNFIVNLILNAKNLDGSIMIKE